MSKNLYDAAVLQLRGRALEALATVELLLKNPTAVPDHSNWVDEIIKHTKVLAENENTMITLQQYFGKQFAPPPTGPTPPLAGPSPTPPPESPGEPLTITPERSPTLRKELTRQKRLQAMKARQAMAKKELYPPADEESGLKEEAPKKKVSKKSRKKNEE